MSLIAVLATWFVVPQFALAEPRQAIRYIPVFTYDAEVDGAATSSAVLALRAPPARTEIDSWSDSVPASQSVVAANTAGEVATVIPKAVHGNSASSTATNYLYRLSDAETGAYLKTGISKNPGSRYTKTFMQDKEMEILQTGTRREMLNLERFIVERDPGPLNREPWAGSMSWDVP